MLPRRLAEPAVAVQGGSRFSLVLRSDGTIHSFGSNGQGQLGRGNTDTVGHTLGSLAVMREPISVGGWAVSVATGGEHVLVMLSDGTVRAFGRGTYGQLGYGSGANLGLSNITLPSMLASVPLGGRALAVGAGEHHSLVSLDNGELRAFGRNAEGQLGVGSTTSRGNTMATIPAATGGVMPLTAAARQATGGKKHSVVVTAEGTVVLTGSNQEGQLAAGATAMVGDSTVSLPPQGGSSLSEGDVVGAAAGDGHTVLLASSGKLVTFGRAGAGQLGRDASSNVGSSAGDSPSKMTSFSLWQQAVAVAAGTSASAAVLVDGGLVTFGDGDVGTLGYGDSDRAVALDEAPQSWRTDVRAASQPRDSRAEEAVVGVATGGGHTLIVLEDGRVRPVGSSDVGQLGLGGTNSVKFAKGALAPGAVVGVGPVVAAAAGRLHSMVLRHDGAVFAFGFGDNGRLGYSSLNSVGTRPSTLPANAGPIDLGGETAAAIAAGGSHSAVITTRGALFTFGLGSFGQLGHGSRADVGIENRPVAQFGRVQLGGARAVAVACGQLHTLVLLEDGTVRSFGNSNSGKLGYGDDTRRGDTPDTTPNITAPVPVGGPAVSVAAGKEHSAVVLADGTLRAFGQASYGQLGYGSIYDVGGQNNPSPAAAGPVPTGGAAVAVACGFAHTLVLMSDGTVVGTGDNSVGQLGVPWLSSVGRTSATLPSAVGRAHLGGRAVAVAAGGSSLAANSFSAVVLEDGTLLTFGSNGEASLGVAGFLPVGTAAKWAIPSLKSARSVVLTDAPLDRPLTRPLEALPPFLLALGSPSLPEPLESADVSGLAGLRALPSGDAPLTSGVHYFDGTFVSSLPLAASATKQQCPTLGSGAFLASLQSVCDLSAARMWDAFDAAPVVANTSLSVNGAPTADLGTGDDPAAAVWLSVGGWFEWAALLLGEGAAGGAAEAAACGAGDEAKAPHELWGGGFVSAELRTSVMPAGVGALPFCRLWSLTELRCHGRVPGIAGGEAGAVLTVSAQCSPLQFRVALPVAYRFPGAEVASARLEGADGATLRVAGRGFALSEPALLAVSVAGSGDCGPVVRRSDSEVTCALGAGTGVGRAVTLRVGGSTAPGSANVSFPGPEITGVSPAVVRAGHKRVNFTVTGRNLLLTSVQPPPTEAGGDAAADPDAELAAAAARGGALWIGGKLCRTELRVVEPGTEVMCVGFDAPEEWPDPGTVRLSVAGQVAVSQPGLFRTIERPRVDAAVASVLFNQLTSGSGSGSGSGGIDDDDVRAELRPGSLVTIVGSTLAESVGRGRVSVTVGGVAVTRVNFSRIAESIIEVALPDGIKGRASVVATSPSGLRSSDAPLAADVAVTMAPPVIVSALVIQPGSGLAEPWLPVPAAAAAAAATGGGEAAAVNASVLLTGRGFARTGVSGIRVGPLDCVDVAVANDTALGCTVTGVERLRGLFPGEEDAALPAQLNVSVEWPEAGHRVTSPHAAVLPEWPPAVTGVTPATAAPGDDVVVVGRWLGRSADRAGTATVGGVACGPSQWLSSSALRCTVPADARLDSMPDRDGDALHLRFTSITGLSVVRPRAIRLLGSVAASLVGADGGGLDPNATLIALPSADGSVIAITAESADRSLAIAVVGLGAQECGFDAAAGAAGAAGPAGAGAGTEAAGGAGAGAGAGATSASSPAAQGAGAAVLVGVSRQSVPRNVSVMHFPGIGVKAPFGTAVSLRPWCSSAIAGQSYASRNVSVAIPSVNVSWTDFAVRVVQNPLAVDPTPLPPINATVTMDPPLGPAMAALVADRLLCQAALVSGATGAVAASLSAAVVALPGAAGRVWVASFAALPLTFIEAGGSFAVRAGCTWSPTSQELALPELTNRVARLRTHVVAVDPGAGVGPLGEFLLLPGVTRSVRFQVDAGLTEVSGPAMRTLGAAPPTGAGREPESAYGAGGTSSPGAAARSGGGPVRGRGAPGRWRRAEASAAGAAVSPHEVALLERALPSCFLRLSGSDIQALPAVSEATLGLALSADNGWAATVPVGVSGVGAGTVSVECSAWGGLQRWSSTSSVALRAGTLRMAVAPAFAGDDGSAGRQLVLSSGGGSFAAVPAVELRAVVAEAPAWSVANAGGISCGVAVAALPASTTQSGTTTRFFASVRAGPTGAIVGVVFDALGLVGVANYPQLGQPVSFSLQCEHPNAGQLPPVRVETELVGLRAAWGRASRQSFVPTSAQWEPFDVEVFTGDGRPLAVPGVASAVRCVAAVGNGTRLEGASAAGAAPDAGRAAAEGMVARAEFRGFAVTGKRGAAFELRVTCSVGDLPLRPVLAHSFRLQGCSAGQQPREASEDLCEACGAGTYSDGGAGASCVPCPKTGASCAGGVLELRRGFYRPPAAAGLPFDGSTELHPCFNAEACTLNSTARRYGCAPGYTGPLCGVCAPGHAMFGPQCGECGPPWTNLAVVAALAAGVLAVACYFAVRTALSARAAAGSDRAIALRLLLSHAQGLGALVLFRAKGTALFQAVTGFMRDIGTTPASWGPVLCATSATFVTRFWATLTLPVVVMALSVAAYAAIAALVLLPARGAAVTPATAPRLPSSLADVTRYLADRKYVVTLAMVLYVMYMPLVSLGVTALECYDRPVGGRRYLRADLSVPCFEGQHAAVAVGAGALLAVLGVGFPVGLVLALRGGKPAPSLRFLFEGFDEERGLRWWEALGLLRKMGLVMAAALVPDAASQVAAAVLVLAPALWAQTRFHPYRASKFNALETMSILAMMLTATVSLLYLQAQGGEAAVQEQTEAHLSGWTEVALMRKADASQVLRAGDAA
ncbi:hypothetical protein FNF31_07457 [Cafeteria roenbergensis]|uniref:RCC1-like domain-containing protein n=1 Tax=Cafeteria roenbergensis TaxID=33653 RepID=A0A5A8C8Q2_CAFRO|nr:hypothetical protein FNF31_07457 [Cafeteria roenbergensis]